jgi:hypothetical protein
LRQFLAEKRGFRWRVFLGVPRLRAIQPGRRHLPLALSQLNRPKFSKDGKENG